MDWRNLVVLLDEMSLPMGSDANLGSGHQPRKAWVLADGAKQKRSSPETAEEVESSQRENVR